MNTTPTSTTEFLDLPDGRLASDDTGDGTLVLRHEFPNGRVPGLRQLRPAAQGGAPSALGGRGRSERARLAGGECVLALNNGRYWPVLPVCCASIDRPVATNVG